MENLRWWCVDDVLGIIRGLLENRRRKYAEVWRVVFCEPRRRVTPLVQWLNIGRMFL